VSICIVDEQGQVRHEAKVAAEVDKIVSSLQGFSNDVSIVGFEAGTMTQYLTGLRSDHR
jgi:hypothetical protein